MTRLIGGAIVFLAGIFGIAAAIIAPGFGYDYLPIVISASILGIGACLLAK